MILGILSFSRIKSRLTQIYWNSTWKSENFLTGNPQFTKNKLATKISFLCIMTKLKYLSNNYSENPNPLKVRLIIKREKSRKQIQWQRILKPNTRAKTVFNRMINLKKQENPWKSMKSQKEIQVSSRKNNQYGRIMLIYCLRYLIKWKKDQGQRADLKLCCKIYKNKKGIFKLLLILRCKENQKLSYRAPMYQKVV